MKPYPKYKDSGIEWIGDIPEQWSLVTLKRLSEIKYGLGQPPAEKENGLPLIRATNVHAGKIYTDDLLLVDPDDIPYDRDPVLRTGDIIVVRSGAYTGDSAIIPPEYDGAITGYDMVVRVTKAHPEFIAYSLLGHELLDNQINLCRLRAAQPHLNAEELAGVICFLPSLPEQQSIASYLDRKTKQIDGLIEKKQNQIDLLREQRAAVINEAVTKGLNPKAKMKDSGIEWIGEIPEHWESKQLRYMASLKSGESITSTDINEEGEYSVFGGNGLRGYTSSYTHEGHFILIGRQGALCGNINYGKDKFWASEHAIVVSPLVPFETLWMGELLRSLNLNRLSVSAAQPGLAVENIRSIKIPVPPLPEQQAIASFLDHRTSEFDTMIAKEERLIELLQEYRTSLISEVVTGKVDVRNEN